MDLLVGVVAAAGACCCYLGPAESVMSFRAIANAITGGGGQVIPTARRVIYASQILAKPRCWSLFTWSRSGPREGTWWHLWCFELESWAYL
ncbi:hypothetical protein IFM89_006290 [Coptis chinensis]|uniref:Uncharacterized protein n=1 Tax=Coptis chinensis TaxID=261450 RepID=A0A835LB68_9MAGN|nr:hypothetical protein IFM89_006290 [Coptis chinensis]